MVSMCCRRIYRKLFIIQFLLCLAYILNRSITPQKSQELSEPPELTNQLSENSVDTPTDKYTSYTVRRLRLEELNDVTALQPRLGPVFNDVTSFRYEINRQDACQTFGNVERTVLVVIVSAVDHVEKRQVIRDTWVSTLVRSTVLGDRWSNYVFLVGSAANQTNERIANESRQFGDLIQVELIDHYSNLSIKSVALLHWVTNYCPQAHFILKCDDDIFVNVHSLASVVRQLKTTTNLYGSGIVGDRPQRQDNKYHVSREIWPWSTYPPYLFGGAYLMGRDAVIPLLAAAQTTPYFKFEDVYITGLCAIKANVGVFMSKWMYERYPKKFDPCLIRRTTMWQTQQVDQLLTSHQTALRVYQQNVSCTFVCNYLNVC